MVFTKELKVKHHNEVHLTKSLPRDHNIRKSTYIFESEIYFHWNLSVQFWKYCGISKRWLCEISGGEFANCLMSHAKTIFIEFLIIFIQTPPQCTGNWIMTLKTEKLLGTFILKVRFTNCNCNLFQTIHLPMLMYYYV